MTFEIEYRRIEEGKFRVNASSEDRAHRLLEIELACGTAPLAKSENIFVKTVSVVEKE
jgi:hypothetical protein